MNKYGLFIFILISLVSCKNRPGAVNVVQISAAKSAGLPSGLAGQDQQAYYHLSEGSEIYPLLWLENLQSVFTSGTAFLTNLDQKFNLIPDENAVDTPLKFVGLTAAWSDAPPKESDFSVARDGLTRLRSAVDGSQPSVVMIGVNCSFCHTGAMQVSGRIVRIDGAPNLVDVRGFFSDMMGGTISMFFDKAKMRSFLEKFPAVKEDASGIAQTMVTDFKKDMDLGGTGIFSQLIEALFRLPHLAVHAKSNVQKKLFERKPVISEHLKRLFKVTFGFRPEGTLAKRMDYLADTIGGNGPNAIETAAGRGRTDAFGRISNLVLRSPSDRIDLTAPVSLPHLWGIKYTAMLQWNANTNSVIMRNVGQALGLGAIVTDVQTKDSTVNIDNLDRLEKLVYKIQVPNWAALFGVPDKEAIRTGCNIYYKECATCHEGAAKVGPASALYDYKLIKLTEIGTDPMQTKNQSIPVAGTPFKDSIRLSTLGLMNRYFERNHIDAATQSLWNSNAYRGREVFRDTLLGENSHTGDLAFVNSEVGMGYPARHLAGIWASPPYLHNASVPTLWHLLTPAARPKKFFVGNREFDTKRVGYSFDVNNDVLEKAATETGASGELTKACERLPALCFDTTATGNSNKGHEYGAKLNDTEKFALIEFMKVLVPEPEYAWSTPALYERKTGHCEVQ